jgi:hypothetical protein
MLTHSDGPATNAEHAWFAMPSMFRTSAAEVGAETAKDCSRIISEHMQEQDSWLGKF